MIQTEHPTINAWNHVVDLAVDPPPPEDPIKGLQTARRGGIPPPFRVPLVYTGISAGPIHLTVQVLDREPDTVAPGWEDVAEVSLVLPEGNVYFSQPTGFRHARARIPVLGRGGQLPCQAARGRQGHGLRQRRGRVEGTPPGAALEGAACRHDSAGQRLGGREESAALRGHVAKGPLRSPALRSVPDRPAGRVEGASRFRGSLASSAKHCGRP